MTLVRPILTSFNGGEISPRMGGRVDTAIYQVAVETLENFVPTVEGPIVKRPGFEVIAIAPDSAAWLTTFRFNLTQDYVILWCEGLLRFFSDGIQLESGPGVPYEVAVPYAAAEASMVSQQQSYDRLYMDHPAHAPARLTRTGAQTFVYDALPLVNGPFADGNTDETVTVQASAASGAGVTLTASSAIFEAGHVGSLFRLEAKDFAAIRAWQVGLADVDVNDILRNEGKVYKALTAGITGTVPPIHTSGTAWDGNDKATALDVNGKGPYGVQWEYLHDHFGIAEITGFTSATVVTATVIRRLPDPVVTTASWRWAHGLFSAAAGWPNLVKTWNGRLVHVKQFDIVASVSGDYLNHAAYNDSGTITADLAFRRTLATEDPPLWAMADRKLLIGTASVELAIGPVNNQAAVAGDNIISDPQSFYGSAAVFPLQAGTSTFFVQRSGRKLREAQYDFAPDRYVAANATVWARHITRGGIIQLAFQKDPEELLLAVRADGQMLAHPHQPEQEIKGFARIRHSDGQGAILSAVTIASADGERDEIWALVERDGVKTVERMADWREDDDPQDEAFFVDSGFRGTAAADQTHFTGLDHLAGKDVAVLAAGGVIPNMTVAEDGTLDLPAIALPEGAEYQYAIGLPFTATCVTLRPELKINGETSQGKRQRMVKLALRVLATFGIHVGPKGGKQDELFDRPVAALMDNPVPLVSADSEKLVGGDWGRLGQAAIVSRLPLPATIVCAMPIIDLEPPK